MLDYYLFAKNFIVLHFFVWPIARILPKGVFLLFVRRIRYLSKYFVFIFTGVIVLVELYFLHLSIRF